MMRRTILPSLLLAAILASTAACADRGGARTVEQGQSRPERRLVQLEWDTLFQVGGTEADTLLELPAWPVADSNGFSVVDAYGARVLRFDTAGSLLWSYGRKGAGPGEFAQPRDAAMDARGRTWVLDPVNARITVIDADGRDGTFIPLGSVEQGVDDFVPLPDGDALLVSMAGEDPLIRVAPDGRVVERRALPWQGHRELESLAAQLETGGDPWTGRWAAAYALGDGLYLFDGMEAVTGRLLFTEPVPFPTVETRVTVEGARTNRTSQIVDPVFGAVSLALSPERVYVLFAGETERSNELVDVYSVTDGAYIESFLLPRAVGHIAYLRGALVVKYSTPWPALAAWRPVGGRLP